MPVEVTKVSRPLLKIVVYISCQVNADAKGQHPYGRQVESKTSLV